MSYALRATNKELTVFGSKFDLFADIRNPLTENARSEGLEVAGIAEIRMNKRKSFGKRF